MPACATDNFSHFVQSAGDLSATYDPYPEGVKPKARPTPSPISTLRRSFSSTFSLIPEESSGSPDDDLESEESGPLHRITRYPVYFISTLRWALSQILNPSWGQMLVVIPTLWISAWLWIFWKCVQYPLNLFQASQGSRKKTVVMISGGSTVQALHLIRNFYCSGARVVVVEIEGLVGLARYSAAVDKFYTVAKPRPDCPQNYVKALCEIAELEKVNYYVPVCASSSAYYDAVAKPHLEVLGCSCFVPGLAEVSVLDDIAEVLDRCEEMGKQTPLYARVTSKGDVEDWYRGSGDDSAETRHFMASCGPSGIKERIKFVMPASEADFRLGREMSEEKPWVVVRDPSGDRFLTCTTVKDSRVVANVTCKIDRSAGTLARENNVEIDNWLKNFFLRLHVRKPVTGHVTFRFARERPGGAVVPLGAKVGVSLPYICHPSSSPHPHTRPCQRAVGKLMGTVLDRREALFAFWDPLPYCAYYRLRLPFSSVVDFEKNKKERDARRPLR